MIQNTFKYSILVICLAFLTLSNLCRAADIDPRYYGNLKFYYNASGNPIVRQITQPLNYTQYHAGNPYGTDSLAFGVTNTTQPAGITTQAMSFEFYSENYFAQNPAGHIAVMLKGDWAWDNPATKPNEALVAGRGIVIGNVSGRPDGCQTSRTAGIESYWSTGNALFSNTCSQQLMDNVTYKVTIHANNNHWIAYWITNPAGTVYYASYAIQDPNLYISEYMSGWLITPVFNSVYSPTWGVYISNLKTWWFHE